MPNTKYIHVKIVLIGKPQCAPYSLWPVRFALQIERKFNVDILSNENSLEHEALRLLSEAGVPTMVMAAPMIPAINDMELERILDAAAAQGATDAGMILLRLPGEVRDVFREWLLQHFPNRVRHVLGLVREARDGKDNDPNFFSRFKGEGPYAVLLQQRFEKARERYGLDRQLPALRTDLFVPPAADDGQLNLF